MLINSRFAQALHHRPEWVGSPSTSTRLSYSSSANRHIRNRQEIPYLDDDEQTSLKKCGRPPAMNSWGRKQICPLSVLRPAKICVCTHSRNYPALRKEAQSQEDVYDPRSIVTHPTEWIGSPSSFKTLVSAWSASCKISCLLDDDFSAAIFKDCNHAPR